ncbi:methyltransferase regulatory domain-containing protein [Suttonella sp. R2A3]|uniref:methyltransferase regulatory domain-containing protein n=1 Tax=Suttonella sp. R2A3 TaxID=2908648 RepID=UPI001F165162|nr:methyltransferase regulatory domain-containing protein [Suttonella sp. R2A3]
MQNWLDEVKVSYACSSNYLDDFVPCLFDDKQQAFLNQIGDPSFTQTAKAYLLNKQFRRDY